MAALRMERSYLSTLLALILHQIDAAFWREWEMFLLPGGVQGFLVFNLIAVASCWSATDMWCCKPARRAVTRSSVPRWAWPRSPSTSALPRPGIAPSTCRCRWRSFSPVWSRRFGCCARYVPPRGLQPGESGQHRREDECRLQNVHYQCHAAAPRRPAVRPPHHTGTGLRRSRSGGVACAWVPSVDIGHFLAARRRNAHEAVRILRARDAHPAWHHARWSRRIVCRARRSRREPLARCG